MHLVDIMQAPRKNSMLNCHQWGDHPPLIPHLGVSVYLVLPSMHHLLYSLAVDVGSSAWGVGVSSELLVSLDEAYWSWFSHPVDP